MFRNSKQLFFRSIFLRQVFLSVLYYFDELKVLVSGTRPLPLELLVVQKCFVYNFCLSLDNGLKWIEKADFFLSITNLRYSQIQKIKKNVHNNFWLIDSILTSTDNNKQFFLCLFYFCFNFMRFRNFFF